jgi:heme O synthase-like polyprenyltransferase
MEELRDVPGRGAAPPEVADGAWLVRAAKAAAVACGAVLLLGSGVFVCPLALVAHQPCPACGLTRASLAALSLDFGRAAALHPLVFVVLPLLGAWASFAAYGYVKTGRAIPSPRAARVFAYAFPALFALLVLVWVARFFGWFGGPAPVI